MAKTETTKNKKKNRKIDIKTEKALRFQLRRKTMMPGYLYTFTYNPKYKNTKRKDGSYVLPIWDRTPIILLLAPKFSRNGNTYILGVNLNHPRYKNSKHKGLNLKKTFGYILDEYSKKYKVETGKGKNKKIQMKKYIDLDYKKILDSDAVYQLKFGVRLYLFNRISHAFVVPIKMYHLVGTNFSAGSLRTRMVINK